MSRKVFANFCIAGFIAIGHGCGGGRLGQLADRPRAPAVVSSPAAAAGEPSRPDRAKPGADGLRRVAPESAAIDASALEMLRERAAAAQSDALVVLVGGAVVVEDYFGHPRGPIEAMSVTKSIVSLAIGRLLTTKVLESLDVPVHRFYPQWKQGRKRSITIRHLLNHTSGLQNVPHTGAEIYPSPDFVELALAAELDGDPGSRFSYNNKAVNLLAGVIERASGVRMDRYIGEEIFAPLGIVEFEWSLDDSGNPHAMSGLAIHAIDLAKLGQLVVQRGRYAGKVIIDPEYFDDALRGGTVPGARTCGLLWWLVPRETSMSITRALVEIWTRAGVEPEMLARVQPLVDRRFDRKGYGAALQAAFPTADDWQLWARNTYERGLPDVDIIPEGEIIALRAEGDLGQHLVVVPSAKLVAVRQKRATGERDTIDPMADFLELVLALVPDDRGDDAASDET